MRARAVRAFFDVPCFHEDLIFEPLVDLERGVRARGEAAGLLDDSYVRAVGRFVQEGARGRRARGRRLRAARSVRRRSLRAVG